MALTTNPTALLIHPEDPARTCLLHNASVFACTRPWNDRSCERADGGCWGISSKRVTSSRIASNRIGADRFGFQSRESRAMSQVSQIRFLHWSYCSPSRATSTISPSSKVGHSTPTPTLNTSSPSYPRARFLPFLLAAAEANWSCCWTSDFRGRRSVMMGRRDFTSLVGAIGECKAILQDRREGRRRRNHIRWDLLAPTEITLRHNENPRTSVRIAPDDVWHKIPCVWDEDWYDGVGCKWAVNES